jgi:diguanylate cyclase (GGDEF)-like protein
MDTPRILVIDDDPCLCTTLGTILSLKGYEIAVAGSGAEGLDSLEQRFFGVVLIALGLPDIPGMELLNRIKVAHPSTEIIILTDNCTLDCAIEATERGAFSFQLKPYDVQQLVLQIRRASEKQQSEEKTRRYNAELEQVNRELKALYEISLSVGHTLDMEVLLPEVLATLVRTGIFPFEIHGAIYLVEEGVGRLASTSSLSQTVVSPCKEILCGQCLCGLAVTSGEIVVSHNTVEDGRHAMCHPDTSPHGRIAVPLKAIDKVVGLLTFYTPPDTLVSEDKLKFFCSLGNLIGIAINNALLFQQIKMSSLHDPLTGLANRRFLDIQLGRSFEASKRYGAPLSILMLDIDHFKNFNDTRGHLEGDRMLQRLAGILCRDMRNADYVFRYGGEEFLIMLPETPPSKACEAAERLRASVQSEAGVTISIGVAAFDHGMTEVNTLIDLADAALYRAKGKGRNRVELSGPTSTRNTVVGAMRAAAVSYDSPPRIGRAEEVEFCSDGRSS